jgi:aminodeoxychorismate synthase component I
VTVQDARGKAIQAPGLEPPPADVSLEPDLQRWAQRPRWWPDAETFDAMHRVGRSLPLSVEFDDPGWEPVDVVAALPRATTVYALETPGGPSDLERRSFLAWSPEYEIVLRRGRFETSARRAAGLSTDPLQWMRARLAREGAHTLAGAPGFLGGLVGYVSYDFKNYLERLPDRVQDDLHTPDLRLGLVRRVMGWDHRMRRVRLSVNLQCTSARARVDRQRALDALSAFHAEVVALVGPGNAPSGTQGRRAVAARTLRAGSDAASSTLRSNLTHASYARMLSRAHEYILAGDLYQANLSHRFKARYTGDGLALYRRLRDINPSPFAAYLRYPEHEVVSCSPERLVRVHDERVETRPIAGTRPRGATTQGDHRLERELLANEKERAEHLMIVDMARNDIGRVCELGSVEVERFMGVERYSHVWHLVSSVRGRLRAGRDALDVLAATFPGASVTGVPKVRCMQIVDELETVRRGIYTGSAGYIGLDGSMDFNILIRSFFLQDGYAYFSVGGGIVVDSDTEREYQETLAKGRALREALRQVQDGTAPNPTA